MVEESTGKNLLDVLLDQLTELGLDFNDIRGQGYDNGANMEVRWIFALGPAPARAGPGFKGPGGACQDGVWYSQVGGLGQG